MVQILSADRYGFKKLDSLTEILIMVGKVAIKQENTIFYADSAVYNRNGKIVEAFKHVHINDNDSIDAYSDYLLYYTDTKIALLRDHVRLTDGKSNLYTDNLQYDVNQKTGVYRNGGKVINGTSVLTSTEGTYYADIKDVYFKNNVKLRDPKYFLQSDSLLYNTNSQIATFITKTYIEDSAHRTITTREGYYDLQNKNASFGRRPTIRDGAATVIANQVQTDEKSGINVLTGNAVYKDTAQGIVLLGNYIISNKVNGTLLATQKPIMILKQEKDSTFVAADTLYSGRLSDLKIELEQRRISDSIQHYQDSLVTAAEEQKLLESAVVQTGNTPDSLSAKLKDSLLRARRDSIELAKHYGSLPDIAKATGKESQSALQKDSLLRARRDSVDLAKKLFGLLPDIAKATGKESQPALQKDSAKAPIITIVSDSSAPAPPKDSVARVIKKPEKRFIISSRQDSAALSLAVRMMDTANHITWNPSDSFPYLAGDPLLRDSVVNDTAARFFRAFHHVRIFSDSLQAVCDSLFYSGQDSIFRMFKDPVVWASKSQVTGDTIYMYTKNKKADQLDVFENGMMINQSGDKMFNQISGNRLFGYFKEGEIDFVRSKGNAESVYYVKDEFEKLIGVNKASSDIIDMRFKQKELNKVVFISAAKGTMYPARQVKQEDTRLQGFNWQEEKRPKTKFELFEN
ncbi:MAG TPA: OstA-like protein [Flavitalea sp.]|nr:OstA-like protein [Flavitalea sp.]